jgi:hypothetical protein
MYIDENVICSKCMSNNAFKTEAWHQINSGHRIIPIVRIIAVMYKMQ